MENLPKAHCKVRKVAENVSWCLAEDPKICRFSLPFGYAHLCQHSSQYQRKTSSCSDLQKEEKPKRHSKTDS